MAKVRFNGNASTQVGGQLRVFQAGEEYDLDPKDIQHLAPGLYETRPMRAAKPKAKPATRKRKAKPKPADE